jgi:NADPH:quinone reductase-like Zn-dependent oxidoreductase
MKVYEIPKIPAGLEGLRRAERPEPKPGPNDVLVRIRAAALNYRDHAILVGSYRYNLDHDTIPCSDGAGDVVAVGPGVTRFKVGDRVIPTFFQIWIDGLPPKNRSALGAPLDGTLAEFVSLHEDGWVAMPKSLSYEEAATLPCAGPTAWNALMLAGTRIKPGDTVLCLGTGGVSMFALQFARLAGATVIATSSSDEKLKRAKALGAAHGINYKTTPDWDKAAVELTGGRGVDQVVEVGGAGTMAKSLGAIRMGGKVSMIGVLSGAADLNPMLIMGKRANVQGISVGSMQMFEAMNRAIAAGGMKPVIDSTFTFDQVREAFKHLQSAQHFGKIVINVA